MNRPRLLKNEELLREPVQRRSHEKRTRLKSAALALFAEKGFEGTSVEEIASRADVAVGGFYQHFRSKKQLLLTLMEELLERLSRLNLEPKKTAGIRAGLRTLLANALSTDLEYLGAYRAWREAAITDAELADKDAQIRRWTTWRVRNLFGRLRKMPGARPEINTAILAEVMDGFFWNFLAEAPKLTKSQLSAWIDAATHLVYHAFFMDAAEH